MFEIVDAMPRQVLPLFRGLHTYHAERLPHVFHAHGQDHEYLQILEDLSGRGAFIFGHCAGWGLVSYALVIPQNRLSGPLHQKADRIFIDHLYVAPSVRGRGLARALIEHLEDWMTCNGFCSWAVSHHAFNQQAEQLYRSAGASPAVLVHHKTLVR